MMWWRATVKIPGNQSPRFRSSSSNLGGKSVLSCTDMKQNVEWRYFQCLPTASTEVCAPQRFRLQTCSLSTRLSLHLSYSPALSLPLSSLHTYKRTHTTTFTSFPIYPLCHNKKKIIPFFFLIKSYTNRHRLHWLPPIISLQFNLFRICSLYVKLMLHRSGLFASKFKCHSQFSIGLRPI